MVNINELIWWQNENVFIKLNSPIFKKNIRTIAYFNDDGSCLEISDNNIFKVNKTFNIVYMGLLCEDDTVNLFEKLNLSSETLENKKKYYNIVLEGLKSFLEEIS